MRRKIVKYVPIGKSLLEFLADMGKKTENSWIFISNGVLEGVINSPSVSCDDTNPKKIVLSWEATKDFQRAEMHINIEGDRRGHRGFIYKISADNIAFKVRPENPEYIFLLRMGR